MVGAVIAVTLGMGWSEKLEDGMGIAISTLELSVDIGPENDSVPMGPVTVTVSSH